MAYYNKFVFVYEFDGIAFSSKMWGSKKAQLPQSIFDYLGPYRQILGSLVFLVSDF